MSSASRMHHGVTSSGGENDYLDTLFSGKQSAINIMERRNSSVKLPALDPRKMDNDSRDGTGKFATKMRGEIKVVKRRKKKTTAKRSAAIKRFLAETAAAEEEAHQITSKGNQRETAYFRDTHQSLFDLNGDDHERAPSPPKSIDRMGDLVGDFSRST